MLQLVYFSTARPELPAAAIDEILVSSRHNNHAGGLVGLLLYDGYHFLQAIEGEPERVRSVYDRIRSDPRHRAVILLRACEVDEHALPDRSLAARRVPIGSGNTVAELVDSLTETIEPAIRDVFRVAAQMRNAA
jgi:hypothetical protein